MGASSKFVPTSANGGDYITVSGSLNIQTSAFTFATWFYWDGLGLSGTINTIIGHDDVAITLLHARASDSVIRSAGTGFDLTSSITTGTWYFVASTFDSSGTGTLRLYLGDKSTAINLKASAASIDIVDGTTDLLIGAYTPVGNNAQSWNGDLAYMHIYNRALSVEELAEIQWKPGSIRNGMNSYYPMFDSSPEKDQSGNGLDGTVTGTIDQDPNGPPVHFPHLTAG